MKIILKITNPKNGLSKLVDATGYSLYELEKTFLIYEPVGYVIKIIRT